MKIEKSLLSGSTPMLVLSLLKDGDKYGYEMVAELTKRSDDTFQLKEGTLYPLLHTLEKTSGSAPTLSRLPPAGSENTTASPTRAAASWNTSSRNGKYSPKKSTPCWASSRLKQKDPPA